MTKITTNLVRFPLGDTKFAEWYKEGVQMMEEVNLTAARVWVEKHVPEQFRRYIYEAVQREYINRHTLTKE